MIRVSRYAVGAGRSNKQNCVRSLALCTNTLDLWSDVFWNSRRAANELTSLQTQVGTAE